MITDNDAGHNKVRNTTMSVNSLPVTLTLTNLVQ